MQQSTQIPVLTRRGLFELFGHRLDRQTLFGGPLYQSKSGAENGHNFLNKKGELLEAFP
jgi:hypothetical protein